MKASEGNLQLGLRRFPVRTLFAYAVLIALCTLFVLPFCWMVFTSMKVGKELFAEKPRTLPQRPNAFLESPFVDVRNYERALSPTTEPHVAVVQDVLKRSGFEFPKSINIDVLTHEMAKGMLRRMEASLPSEVWKAGDAEVREQAAKLANTYTLTELLQNVYRRYELGKVIVRSVDLEDQVLGEGVPMSQRFKNETPQIAEVFDVADMGTSCAMVQYDFSKGDEIVLTQTFRTEFDLRKFLRIAISMRNDDNWQRMYLSVEKLGQKFRSRRPVYLANSDWFTQTWQEPGPDDESNRIKNWIHLLPEKDGKSDVTDPHELRLTIRIQKTSQLQAWWGKISMNYIITAQFIPFVRYVGNSLFLIMMNVTLMLFSSSIVAYGVSRLVWPGRDLVFLLILATIMVPEQVTMIPAFLIWKNLGFYNTLVPLWLGAAFGAPVNIFLLRQFMRGIPRDVEDAAKIDGCGVLRVYWHIILPLVRPALAAIALLTIVAGWNDFKAPLLYIADQRLYTLAFGLYAFSIQVASDPAQTMAAAILTAAPVVLLFLVAQKHFIRGVTLTGIKG